MLIGMIQMVPRSRSMSLLSYVLLLLILVGMKIRFHYVVSFSLAPQQSFSLSIIPLD